MTTTTRPSFTSTAAHPILRLALLIAIPIAIVSGCDSSHDANTTDTGTTDTGTTQRIYEDDPRWDCHTMGNRICGPQA